MRIGINGSSLNNNHSGVGRYLVSLLRIWARTSRQHEYYVYIPSGQKLFRDYQVLFAYQNIHLRVVSRLPGISSYFVWFGVCLPLALTRDHVDIFFSSDYFLPPFIGRRIKKTMSIHDVSYISHPDWFPVVNRFLYNIFSLRPARTADCIFTISNFSKNELLRFLPGLSGRIVVTPLASDLDPNAHGSILPLPFSLVRKRYFLVVGTVFNRRYPIETMRAFDRFLKSDDTRSIQLVFRGRNTTRPYIDVEGFAATLNRKWQREAIRFLPPLSDEDLVRLYHGAIASLYLSNYEGFGLPVIESMACGTPTVAVRATAIPEVGGEAAIYVDPHDINQISAVMRRLLSDVAWVRDIKQRSIIQASRFSWEQTASRTMRSLESCLS